MRLLDFEAKTESFSQDSATDHKEATQQSAASLHYYKTIPPSLRKIGI